MKTKTNRFLAIEHNRVACVALALAIGQLLLCCGADAIGRGLEVGQKVPEFSATDIAGQPFDYKHGRGKAVMVAFLSAAQKQSADAAADIHRIVARLGAKAEGLDVVVVAYEPNNQNCFQPKPGRLGAGYRVLPDKGFGLWGRFGIIAIPTVIISDPNDKVSCVKAGYAYDFAPVIRAHLNQALGIAQDILPEDASTVKTAAIDTSAARAMRHLQMATMLKKNGRIESAIRQAREARQLDPNCLEAALELGELYCRSGRARAALEVIGQLEGSNELDRARVSLLLGWAKRQMSQLDAAEKLLLEATTLNPQSSRGIFELGKIYQARGQTDKAMVSYRKALAQLFSEAEGTKSPAQQQGQKPNISKSIHPQ